MDFFDQRVRDFITPSCRRTQGRGRRRVLQCVSRTVSSHRLGRYLRSVLKSNRGSRNSEFATRDFGICRDSASVFFIDSNFMSKEFKSFSTAIMASTRPRDSSPLAARSHDVLPLIAIPALCLETSQVRTAKWAPEPLLQNVVRGILHNIVDCERRAT
jgi:hypothetical protein